MLVVKSAKIPFAWPKEIRVDRPRTAGIAERATIRRMDSKFIGNSSYKTTMFAAPLPRCRRLGDGAVRKRGFPCKVSEASVISIPKFGPEQRQRLAAMAHLVLHLLAQFGECGLMAFWNEQRVIAKASLTARGQIGR